MSGAAIADFMKSRRASEADVTLDRLGYAWAISRFDGYRRGWGLRTGRFDRAHERFDQARAAAL
jgi:hypothetical protein